MFKWAYICWYCIPSNHEKYQYKSLLYIYISHLIAMGCLEKGDFYGFLADGWLRDSLAYRTSRWSQNLLFWNLYMILGKSGMPGYCASFILHRTSGCNLALSSIWLNMCSRRPVETCRSTAIFAASRSFRTASPSTAWFWCAMANTLYQLRCLWHAMVESKPKPQSLVCEALQDMYIYIYTSISIAFTTLDWPWFNIQCGWNMEIAFKYVRCYHISAKHWYLVPWADGNQAV